MEYVGSFGGWGVSLTRPVLESVLLLVSTESLSHVRTAMCLVVKRISSSSYMPRVAISLFVRRVGHLFIHAPC